MRALLAVLILALLALCAFADPVPAPQWRKFNSTELNQNPVPARAPSLPYSDVEAGGGDLFAATRWNFTSLDKRLEIFPGLVCEGEDIPLQVLYEGLPVSGATVGLYSHGGGRALVSEVSTDEWGKAVFSRKKKGNYDLVATKTVFSINSTTGRWVSDDYPLGQVTLKIGQCPAGWSGAPLAGTPQEPEKAADANKASAPDGGPAATKRVQYAGGLERTFQNITLADGKEAVRVSVRAMAPYSMGSATLVEFVPPAVVSDARGVGFEQNYPAYVSPNGTVRLEWVLDNLKAGAGAERSYVIRRPASAVEAGRFETPLLLDENRTVVAGRIGQGLDKGPAAWETAPKNGGGFRLEAPQIPLWLAGAAVLLIVIAAAAFVWIQIDLGRTEK